MLKLHHMLVALIAAGAITTIDSGLSRQGPAVPLAAKSELRITESATAGPPDLRGRVAVAVETKGALFAGQKPCERQVWPYIPARCLLKADGRQDVPRPVRMITMERSIEGGSELIRMPAAEVAAR